MSKSIFVGNIPYGAMEKEIKEAFSEHGEVLDVHFVMDWQKGRFRGFGFVTMNDDDADVAVTKMDSYEFQGRHLKVSLAKASSDRQSA